MAICSSTTVVCAEGKPQIALASSWLWIKGLTRDDCDLFHPVSTLTCEEFERPWMYLQEETWHASKYRWGDFGASNCHSNIPTTTCRGQRANDLLSITVGTQSISPFYWSIDSGAFGAVLLVFLGFFGHLTHGLIWSKAGRSKRCQDYQVMSGLVKPWRFFAPCAHTHTVTFVRNHSVKVPWCVHRQFLKTCWPSEQTVAALTRSDPGDVCNSRTVPFMMLWNVMSAC